jgi:hypothetical protein
MDIPGIPKQDVADMVNYVKSDLNMVAYAEGLIKISGNKGYPAPNRNWEAGTIKLDFTDDLNTRRRADHLKEWENNVSIMFSKKNLNKMRVAYGNKFVQQLENLWQTILTGMITICLTQLKRLLIKSNIGKISYIYLIQIILK